MDPPTEQRALPPTFIPMPPPAFNSVTNPATGVRPDDRTPDSPYLQFFTAPSSPFVDQDEHVHGPLSPSHHLYPAGYSPAPPTGSPNPPSPPLAMPSIHADSQVSPSIQTGSAADYFQSEQGLGLEDESLSALEKIYLFSRSKSSFHRVFIVHAMAAFLDQISAQEAVDYVLPLLSGLAMDEGPNSISNFTAIYTKAPFR